MKKIILMLTLVVSAINANPRDFCLEFRKMVDAREAGRLDADLDYRFIQTVSDIIVSSVQENRFHEIADEALHRLRNQHALTAAQIEELIRNITTHPTMVLGPHNISRELLPSFLEELLKAPPNLRIEYDDYSLVNLLKEMQCKRLALKGRRIEYGRIEDGQINEGQLDPSLVRILLAISQHIIRTVPTIKHSSIVDSYVENMCGGLGCLEMVFVCKKLKMDPAMDPFLKKLHTKIFA